MVLSQIKSYEIKLSKDHDKIPIVNGVYLHSLYDPHQEAENLIQKYKKQLSGKSNVLFLGLGFAYHIDCAIKWLKYYHNSHFSIMIIEPNEQITQDYFEFVRPECPHISVNILSGKKCHELYADKNLLSFLLKKPIIISHPPSFELYQEYFRNFLSYKASQKLADTLPLISSEVVIDYLGDFPQEVTLVELIKQKTKDKKHLEKDLDYLALGLNHIGHINKNEKHTDH